MAYADPEKKRERDRKRWAENREKLCEQKRQFRAANLEMMRERDRKYREENREKLREQKKRYRPANQEYMRRFRAANIEKVRERERQRYANNPKKMREYEIKRSARKKAAKSARNFIRMIAATAELSKLSNPKTT